MATSTVDVRASTVDIEASTINQWYKVLYHCYMTITLEKISTGVFVTEKKLEKACRKSDNNLAKQLSLKEAEVQRLESEFKHTKAEAQNLKAQKDEALAKIISLKSEVKDFFVSAGSSQEKALLERNPDVIFVRDSSKLNAENLPFFADILSLEG